MPTSSMALFATRDSMTILASFSLPPILGQYLSGSFGIERAEADTFAQLFTPVTMQIFSTPLHLHGLDLYNRDVATQQERLAFIGREYVSTALARMARIFPAFGIGGVVNKYIRKHGRETLDNYYK